MMLQEKTEKRQNPNWSQTPYHSYRTLIFGDSGSAKANALLNLTSHQPDIDKIHLYAIDLN